MARKKKEVTIAEQLLLFEEPIEGRLLREFRELKESVSKIRKSQFAKLGQLRKDYDDLKQELEFLKANICKSESTSKNFECEILPMQMVMN